MRFSAFRQRLIQLLVPTLIVVVGIGLSSVLGYHLQQQATDTWQKRAEQAAAQQSMTLLGWIEESFGMLSGLVALVENSGNVDSDEFLNAVDGMESRAKVNFIPVKALLENTDDGWRVRYSSAASQADTSYPKQDSPPAPLLLEALTNSQDTPNEWLMSPPFTDAAGKQHVYVALVSAVKPEFAIVGVLVLQRMVENLAEANGRDGMFLDLKLTAEGSATPVTLNVGHAATPVVYGSNTLAYTARANLDLNWQFTDDFDGGSDSRLGLAVWGSGVLLSVVMAFFVAALLRQNRHVQQRVDAATRDIEQAMALKNEVAEISLEIQQAYSPTECGIILFHHFSERLGCRQGMLATATPEGDMEVVARYGAQPEAHAPSRYAAGEGIVGECARNRKSVSMKLPEDEAWRIRSGLGSTAPAEVWLMPIEYGDTLVGIIELAMLHPLDASGQTLLAESTPMIALRLGDLLSRTATENVQAASNLST